MEEKMLQSHQIASMNDAQIDAFLKRLMVRYIKKTQGMNSLDLLNTLLNFALDEEIIKNECNDRKNTVLNRVQRALTEV